MASILEVCSYDIFVSYHQKDNKGDGWGLYKQGKVKEALEILEKSWDLKPMYNHQLYLHIEEVKKALAGKN